jgi:signal transduction histidine kinase
MKPSALNKSSRNPAERFHLCAPIGKDSALITETLHRENIGAQSFGSLELLADAFNPEVQGLIIAQEALQPAGMDRLHSRLRGQPAWSDVPIILLTMRGREASEAATRLIELFGVAGNITMIERPVRVQTFLSMVRSARRARLRQYEVRDLLLQRDKDASQLMQARDALEQRVHERTAELDLATRNLQELSARLMRLRDEEARRIARDLHDSAGQLVAAIGMNLGVVKAQANTLDAGITRAIADSQTMLNELSREIRTMSHLLHPPLLDEMGLVPAVQAYVDGYSARSSIAVDLMIPKDFGRLSADTEIVCFRIVQECLTNIHRHSKSSTAAISLRHQGKCVLVEVRDQGKGIPPERLSEVRSSGGGVGLAGMRERVRNLGGTLEIKSDHTGTCVTATLPAKRSGASA